LFSYAGKALGTAPILLLVHSQRKAQGRDYGLMEKRGIIMILSSGPNLRIAYANCLTTTTYGNHPPPPFGGPGDRHKPVMVS